MRPRNTERLDFVARYFLSALVREVSSSSAGHTLRATLRSALECGKSLV